MMKDPDAAGVSLDEALKHCPPTEIAGINAIMKEKSKVDLLSRQAYAKQKKTFAGIFEKLSVADSNSESKSS